jgi:integrase
MPKLTTPTIGRYRPHASKRREISDTGHKGLRLVLQPGLPPRRSWIVRLRRPGGKSAKITLGPFNDSAIEPKDDPVLGAPLTLLQARELSNQIDRQRARGLDPVTEHKAEQKRKHDAAVGRATNTFGAALPEFFIKHRTKKWNERPRRWCEDAAILGLYYPLGSDPAIVKPEIIKGGLADVWADKPIADIDKYVVDTAIEEASEQSGSRARKMYSALRVFFKGLPLKLRPAINPVFGVDRPAPPKERDIALDKDEIVWLWKACDKIGGPFGALWKILLLTGCRQREVSDMVRTELGDNGVLEVPSSRTKNHLPFLVPLSAQALDGIGKVPRIKESTLVFTTNGRTAISGFSKAKAALDIEMAKVAGQPIKHWKIHDLRRTVSTIMNESPEDGGLGIAPHIVEACLNHVSGGAKASVAGTYNKAKYLSEKRAALARWADHVDGLVQGRKAKVLPMQAKRKKGQ